MSVLSSAEDVISDPGVLPVYRVQYSIDPKMYFFSTDYEEVTAMMHPQSGPVEIAFFVHPDNTKTEDKK